MLSLVMAFYKGKKVFITGHTGFKGSWLSYWLLELGAVPIGYALKPNTEPALFALLGLDREMVSCVADIRDLDALKVAVLAAQPDIVIHMAAQPIVRAGYEDPVGTYETNVMGTVNLLDACRAVDSIRSIVNVTTDKVYENKERREGYREDEILCGRDPYSNSKSCSELVTASFRQSFFSDAEMSAVSTARSGNVIGGGDFAKDRIVPDCVRAAMREEKIMIRNPHSVRPYQHVLECLSGYLLLAEKQYENKAIEGAYNFGPDPEDCLETEEIVKSFCSAWGEGLTYDVRSDDGPHEADLLMLDNAKAKRILGWAPQWTIRESIEKVARWAKAYRDEPDSVIAITREQIQGFNLSVLKIN